MTTEDKITKQNLLPVQISLTDCLACSGCVTSAEAVLVSLQSHTEVLNALDSTCSIPAESLRSGHGSVPGEGKVFIASVSPQTRASIAATFGVSEKQAGFMIEQLLSGPDGLRSGGAHRSHFTWVLDTNTAREACLVLGFEEVMNAHAEASAGGEEPQKPILASSCPGWICYAEKTHPHILPHLSRLKSPQALLGTLVKSALNSASNISPSRIWHVAIMPCFDKKLEASREELTDVFWKGNKGVTTAIRDVDCVITTKELLMLAASRGIDFSKLPKTSLQKSGRLPFPDQLIDQYLFRNPSQNRKILMNNDPVGGTSGGYLYHILETFKAKNPGSEICAERGRNEDVVDFTVVRDNKVLLKTARYYGFRNIQNLVRKLKPPKVSRMPGARTGIATRPEATRAASLAADYAYVEVMACPGGCTNGGGQIKVSDAILAVDPGSYLDGQWSHAEQKAWLARVDEAYFSADSSEDESSVEAHNIAFDNTIVNGISAVYTKQVMRYWEEITGTPIGRLAYTTYRKVESDVGKEKVTDTERVIHISSRAGGGW